MKTTQEIKPKKSVKNRIESVYNDPNTGKFIEGNPGKPVGTKHERDFSEFMDEVCVDIAIANKMEVDEVYKVLYKVGYAKAKEGNYSFYKDWMDRKHGQATVKTENKNLNVNVEVKQDRQKIKSITEEVVKKMLDEERNKNTDPRGDGDSQPIHLDKE